MASDAHSSVGPGRRTRLSVKGDRFLINGSLSDLYGIRVASATQSDEYTAALIDNLEDYRDHGVRGVAPFFQGSNAAFSDPFGPDGTEIDQDHLRRMRSIIEACDARGMIVVVGIFYQRSMANMDDVRRLRDGEAVRQAVRTVTETLKGYSNIIINIANEQNSSFYTRQEFFDFNDPIQIIDLCRIAHEVDPDRPVGAGGYSDPANIVIGKSPHVDALLFDTFSGDIERDQDSGWHYDHFVENGVTGKPIVNVEMFGGWTARCRAQSGEAGYYTPADRRLHLREIEAAAERPGLSVFFHSNVWCQGPSAGLPLRYDLGGQGEEDDLGIRWWFEHVQSKVRQTQEGEG